MKTLNPFVLQQKLESTDVYDAIKDGRMDVAASIATPERRVLTVYTDPKFDKADQHVLTMLVSAPSRSTRLLYQVS
jgi:hypothetical protein